MEMVRKGLGGAVALVAMLGLAGSAMAEQGGKGMGSQGWHAMMQGSGTRQGTAGSAGRPAFRQLDPDHDGYISKKEASKYPPLYNSWGKLTKHGAWGIDRAEFSAFEAGEQAASGAPHGAMSSSSGSSHGSKKSK